MGTAKSALQLFISCLVYAIIISAVDFVIIFVFQRDLGQVKWTLSIITFAEGGLALVTGGATASFSSTFGKIGEMIFHAEPWDIKRLREVERTARVWITTGYILFLLGLLLSAL